MNEWRQRFHQTAAQNIHARWAWGIYQSVQVCQTHFRCIRNWYMHWRSMLLWRLLLLFNFGRFKREIIGFTKQQIDSFQIDLILVYLSLSLIVYFLCVIARDRTSSLRPSQGCIYTTHCSYVLLSNRQIRHFSSGKSNAAIHWIHFLKYWLWTGPWIEYSQSAHFLLLFILVGCLSIEPVFHYTRRKSLAFAQQNQVRLWIYYCWPQVGHVNTAKSWMLWAKFSYSVAIVPLRSRVCICERKSNVCGCVR